MVQTFQLNTRYDDLHAAMTRYVKVLSPPCAGRYCTLSQMCSLEKYDIYDNITTYTCLFLRIFKHTGTQEHYKDTTYHAIYNITVVSKYFRDD